MGMFDYVKCEVPLPDDKPATVFQTKDFGLPMLETYVITSDGRLVFEPVRQRGKARDPTENVDIEYHGFLNFYTYEQEEWREYNAKFTDGQLVEIVEVEGE